MKKKISVGMAVALMIIAASLTFVISSVSFITVSNRQLADYSAISQKFQKLFRFDEVVNGKYVREIDQDQLMDGLLKGYVYGLGDKYSTYLDKESYTELMQSLNTQFQGIGIRVISDEATGYVRIVNVVENSPAQEAGVKSGDLICEVEGKDVLEVGYYTAIADLKGENGTTAVFSVLRGGERISFEVLRKEFESKSITYKTVGDNLGYMRFEEFTLTTPDEFKNAMAVFREAGVRGLIFDVRNNPGGELGSITSVLDQILPSGTIVTTTDRNGEGEEYTSDANCIELPMAVLINGSTYSAAELFAAALRDYDAATLVGTNTYGKGMMQNVIPLGDGTAVSLTTAFFNPPSGVNFEGVGVAPDQEVEMPEELQNHFYELSVEEDVQLQAAINVFPPAE